MKSTRKGSVQACTGLLHVGARLTGVVMNAVPTTREAYGGGYYGGYGHYRHADDAPAAKALLTDETVSLVHPSAKANGATANGKGHVNGNGGGRNGHATSFAPTVDDGGGR